MFLGTANRNRESRCSPWQIMICNDSIKMHSCFWLLSMITNSFFVEMLVNLKS